MKNDSTIDLQEVAKFKKLADTWWNKEGELKTLHDINPCRINYILQHADLVKKTVLDVGCGGGILTESMSGAGAQVIGLDADESIIRVAQNHAQEEGLEIEYVCQPIETYQHQGFDVITCMEMLEHVQEPQVVIHHCVRLLKPGGYLFLSTINRTMQAYMQAIVGAEYILGILPKQTHDYHKFIKPSELATILRKEEIELKDLSGLAYNPFTRVASLSSKVEVNYLVCATKG